MNKSLSWKLLLPLGAVLLLLGYAGGLLGSLLWLLGLIIFAMGVIDAVRQIGKKSGSTDYSDSKIAASKAVCPHCTRSIPVASTQCKYCHQAIPTSSGSKPQ
jgi:hypothetical protein